MDALERENAELRRDVDRLRSAMLHGGGEANEIIVSGLPIPSSLISPVDLIRSIFTFEASELCSHILNVRVHNNNNNNYNKNSRRDGPGSQLGTKSACSYFVSLSSAAVCRAVIAKKRKKRTLKQKDVCPISSDLLIYINEVLSKETYNLLQSAKIAAKEKSYKYVWCRLGQICMRQSDGQPIILINSESDLTNLI